MMPTAQALLVALLATASLPASSEPASLYVANRRIVTFRATVNGNDPAARVRAALQRIDALPHTGVPERVTTQPVVLGDASGYAVLVGRSLAFVVTENDRDPLGGDDPADQLAAVAGTRLAEALQAWRDQRSVKVIVRGLWQAGVATTVLVLAVWILVRLRRKVAPRLSRIARSAAESMLRGRLDVEPIVTAAVRTILNILFWSLVVLLLDIWITFGLGRFPLTAPWSDVLTRRVLDVVSAVGVTMLRAIPGLVAVAVIFLVARFVARFLESVFDRVERGALTIRGLYPETVSATRRIVAGLVWLVALAASWPYIPGSDSGAVKGLSLLVGVMLSFGSTGLVSQVMSGLAVIYSRALSAGDTVRVGDVEGVVSEVGLLSTKIVTVPGEEVTFPNSVLIGSAVRNYTRLAGGAGPLVTTTVTIGYDAPWRQVHDLLLGAARETPSLRRDPAPFVLQRALNDFYVEYQLLVRLEGDPLQRPRVLSDLHARVQDAFNAAGVQIMSPHFFMQPEKRVLVPPERRDGGRASPQRQSG